MSTTLVLNMNISIQGEYQFQEAREGVVLQARSTTTFPRTLKLWWFFFALLIVGYGAHIGSVVGWFTMFVGVAVFFGQRILFRYLLSARTRRALQGAPPESMAINLEITDDGITFQSAPELPVVSWDTFTAWVEGKHVILLCRIDAPPISFPKRLFQPPESWSSFRDLLTEKYGKPTKKCIVQSEGAPSD